jgi:acetyltransferase-like isoleucine patch superfamily enzyme
VNSPRSISIGHHATLLDGWCLANLCPVTHGAEPKIRIGSYCNIMHDFQCNARVSVEMQDYVLILPRVFITVLDHVVAVSARTTLCSEFRSAPVVIEHDCWLGVSTVVLKGVRIRHHSSMGANTVATQDVALGSNRDGVGRENHQGTGSFRRELELRRHG